MADGVTHPLGGGTSMSIWKTLWIYICTSLFGYSLRRVFFAALPSSGVGPDVIAGYSSLIAMVVVAAIVIRRNPGVARRLSFRLNIKYLPFSIALGLLAANASYAIQTTIGKTSYFQFGALSLVTVVLIVPIVEEIFCRGVILESLFQRQGIPVAVLLSTVLIALDHASFFPALVGQVILSVAYIGSRRSLSVSMIAHAVANLAAGFPSDVLRYTHYFKH